MGKIIDLNHRLRELERKASRAVWPKFATREEELAFEKKVADDGQAWVDALAGSTDPEEIRIREELKRALHIAQIPMPGEGPTDV